MDMKFEFKDNTKELLKIFNDNKVRALTAVGQVGTEVVIDQMMYGYDRSIYQTGDLIRDVNSKVRPNDYMVDIGNSLNYSGHVHNGTRKMVARPYLKDGILNNIDVIEEVMVENLKDGIN